ncbi:Pentulose kinase [Rickenella mellea]|uniref:Pentulose kinase n=1 Tax=Rickenella mellea TaxID=50990 RepID=A0A4R5XEH3_9AGAM|nr:Pentulose kinase [Rickenella mellea]
MYIGIDVGTGSVRAALVEHSGQLVASSTRPTVTFRDDHDHRIFEQSTTDIWQGICASVRDVLKQSQCPPENIKGIGIDATCSLAVTDADGQPVIVTKGDDLGKLGNRNIILWADHRAEEEAEIINKTGAKALAYVGGTMSLEMEVPKMLWLKNRMSPSLFSRCHFFDLPDYLTYRATRSRTRSSCSLTCKCSFLPDSGWDKAFFEQIGLGDFAKDGYALIGAERGPKDVLTAGLPVSEGLSEEAARELGLIPGTPVGSGVIDAYAGWIGTIAARYKRDGKPSDAPTLDESRHRLAAVAGTSTCHLVQSPDGVFVNGVWGPYKNVVFPGWWMNEGGQSSTGQLIDFMITTHPAYPKLVERAKNENTNIHNVLADQLNHLRKEAGVENLTELTKDMHIYPDLHGNRSPIADPRMRGAITGLTLDHGLSDLARKFNVTLEAIALQTKHIIDSMNASGHTIQIIYISGGQTKNKPLMQLFANTCGIPVVLPASTNDAVTLGAAMLGRFAAEAGKGGKMKEGVEQAKALWDIMVEMTSPGTLIAPAASPKEKRLLEVKYKIFRESIEIQKRWRDEIEAACG